jgi:hypothetical protein
MWTRGIDMRALHGSWACICAAARESVSVIGTGTRSCACVGRWVPIRLSVSPFKFTREASCLPCIPDLPRFLLCSFYYVPTTEAPLRVLRVRPPACDYGWMVGCIFSTVFCVLFSNCVSASSHILDVFFWMDCIAPSRFERVAGRGRDVRTAFLLRIFPLDWNLGFGRALRTFT